MVDSATTCADKVAEILGMHNLHSKSRAIREPYYYVSDDPKKFQISKNKLL